MLNDLEQCSQNLVGWRIVQHLECFVRVIYETFRDLLVMKHFLHLETKVEICDSRNKFPKLKETPFLRFYWLVSTFQSCLLLFLNDPMTTMFSAKMKVLLFFPVGSMIQIWRTLVIMVLQKLYFCYHSLGSSI